MNKQEVCYKFIFTNYDKLSGTGKSKFGTDTDPIVPTSDGVDQEGEVLSLCRKCPERVITYDQLDNPTAAIYLSAWPSSRDSEREAIKSYVDYWKDMPKYFNLRNYWDAYPAQEGGMSLMVSHSPDIGGEYASSTKFNIDGKFVYCNLMVSSGDFFYEWNLPSDIIVKSGLRDNVVGGRFHSNWYFQDSYQYYNVTYKLKADWPVPTESNPNPPGYPDEYPIDYPSDGYTAFRPRIGQEKRVFVQAYFKTPGFQYIYQGTAKSYINFTDVDNTVIYQAVHVNNDGDSGVYFRDNDGVSYRFNVNNPYIPYKATRSYRQEDVVTTNPSTGVSSNNQATVQEIFPVTLSGVNYNFYYYDKSTNTETPLIRHKYYYEKNMAHGANTGYITVGTISDNYELAVTPSFVVEDYREIDEDLKRDFVDLEVTRRILYYDDYFGHDAAYRDTHLRYTDSNNVDHFNEITPTSDIPIRQHKVDLSINDTNTFLQKTRGDADYWDILQTDKTGYHTELSYELPAEYISSPPLQIPYNLLRYSLNDRPPFTDCETVLVMWVATPYRDSNDNLVTPDTISNGDVESLHKLNWQQYAIPISVRCCFKEPVNSHKYCTDRFLVLYPNKYDNDSGKTTYRYHTRCNESYKSDIFREAIYLKGLVEYSRDYVVTYQAYGDKGNANLPVIDVQKYLFDHCSSSSSFSAIYARRQYNTFTGTQQQQCYYILVPDNMYYINKGRTGTYVTKYTDHSSSLKLSASTVFPGYSTRWGASNFHTAYYLYICLFKADDSNISIEDGTLKLTSASTLRTLLQQQYLKKNDTTGLYEPIYSWDNIYLCSFGILPDCRWSYADCLLYHNGAESCLSLGFLDNHISIGNTTYGSTANGKVVVGFKDAFDYKHDDYLHFTYDSVNNVYTLVNDSNVEYTAYIMDYIPPTS